MIYKWLKNNLYSVLTKQCLLCLSPTYNKYLLCEHCEDDLTKNTHFCIVCATPFSAVHSGKNALVCGKCQKEPPYYTTSLIPYLYSSPLKQLITHFKFHGNLAYAPLLAQIFINSIRQRETAMPECIIPVPLHSQRLRERGFNQALELTRIISKQLQIPVNYSLCQRHKATPFQSGLSAQQRKQNIKNAFSITKHHLYKHIVIFDDVVTTGTTANELARKLKQSGVKTIEVWAIARTVEKGS